MKIGILGPFLVRTDEGAEVDLPGARLRGLLAALALDAGRGVPRAALVDWLWGERPPADAAGALQQLVSRLRKALPDGAVEGLAGGYRLTVDRAAVDALVFEDLLADARGAGDAQRAALLHDALGLWRGAVLQDVDQLDSEAFDAAVARLDGLRLAALEDRFEATLRVGTGVEELVPELTDAVATHPLRERLVASLMRALVAVGRESEALVVYERARQALAGALGVDPSPELAGLHLALLRGELSRRDDVRATNVRAELTSFVGGDRVVAAVRDLVAEHRLTTLVGPGGLGKTRLASETARTLLGAFPDGVWLVELAPLGPDDDIAQAAVGALRLRDALLGSAQTLEPTDRIVAALRDREALLVLDNCEHVIDHAAAFAHRVLGECRRVRILATSREPLGITGEVLWSLEPLAVPDDAAGPQEVVAAPAVALFLDRVRAVRHDLPTDPAALATVARICRELDGMPLALEMAAARLRTMSLDELAERLGDRFRLLTSGSRAALPRHRTLRAVVDWSWELLGDAERAVLRRLAVFSGGASLEGAEAACAGDGVEVSDVLDLLTSLAEKSLVVADAGAPSRYRLSGIIREYAAQRLEEAGERERARRAHLAYVIALAEEAEPHLRRAEQLEWIARLELERDNTTAAMRGAIAAGEAQEAMRLAASAGWYWWLGGRKTEGMELVTAATRVPGEVDDELRAVVYLLVVQFVTSGLAGQHEAEGWIREAAELGRRSRSTHPLMGFVRMLEGLLDAPATVTSAIDDLLDDADPWVRALARLQRGKMRSLMGDGGRDVDADLEGALAELRVIGERFGISFALSELAERVAMRGEFAEASDLFEQAIAVVGEVGASDDVIRMRARQAELAWAHGDEEASAAALAEAERVAERVTWPDALAILALSSANLARWRGDAAEARRQLERMRDVLGDEAQHAPIRMALEHAEGFLATDLDVARAHHAAAVEAAVAVDYPLALAEVLVGVADVALRAGDVAHAARLLGAAAAKRGFPDRSHADTRRISRAVRASLGEAAAGAEMSAGAAGSWSELVDRALRR